MQHVHLLVLLRKFKYSSNASIESILRTVAQFRTTYLHLPGGINKTTKNLRQHSRCSGQDASHAPQEKRQMWPLEPNYSAFECQL